MKILSLNHKEHAPMDMKPYVAINITPSSREKWVKLSPFFVGPVSELQGRAQNVENYWQFSKIFPKQWDEEAQAPKEEYFTWREKGFKSTYAHRYPMGRSKPIGFWIDGIGLKDQVAARKMLYVPAYENTLKKLPIYQDLMEFIKNQWQKGNNLIMWDYDTFNHEKKGLSLTEVINDPKYKYGHGFVLINIINNYIKNHLES